MALFRIVFTLVQSRMKTALVSYLKECRMMSTGKVYICVAVM